MSETTWKIPVGEGCLHEGAALFLCALLHPQGGPRALMLYEACGAFLAREVRRTQGAQALVPELADLIGKVKTQQMDNRLNRAHRSILRLLLTREHILGASIRPFLIPLASEKPGASASLKLITSPATTRQMSSTKRDPRDVQHDRMWADARRLTPATAGPRPENFVGTLGPVPVAATHNIVTEDVDPSLNGLIAEAAKQMGITPRNFRRDYLNAARPVLHLAQALYQLSPKMKAKPDEDLPAFIATFNPRKLLVQVDWVKSAVQSANRTHEWWPGLQQQSPGLQAIDPSRFIRLEEYP